jgi:flagellar FliL protein
MLAAVGPERGIDMALFRKKPKTSDAPAEADAGASTPAPEGEGGEGQGEETGKKKLPLKFIIIGAVAGLVLVGGGGGAFMMFGPHGPSKAGAHAHKARKKGGEGGDNKPADKNAPQITDGPDGVVFYTLPDMVVNMQTADGKPTYLKLKLTLELPGPDTVDVIEPNRPRLQDMFQSFLRELRPEDLAGSQGSYELRMEILRRVNLVIAPAKINSVLIEEMLIT